MLARCSTPAITAAATLDFADEQVRQLTSEDASADGPVLPATAELRRRYRLTEREAEVALLLAQRRSSKEIARMLEVSSHTARRHTERVLGKLGISSRRDVLAVITRPLWTDIVWRLSGTERTRVRHRAECPTPRIGHFAQFAVIPRCQSSRETNSNSIAEVDNAEGEYPLGYHGRAAADPARKSAGMCG